ncbi:ABC transporter permease [Enemella sp. A6]|uniref:ABC transporter permease n=1 Tax=Enemella sp. A6 TaxID=3440152 RepID=UPI003EB8B7E6
MAGRGLLAVLDRRKILRILVKRDLRVRYAQSFLGYLWTIIDPLAMALIYFMIFVVIFQRPDAGYAPYFLFLLTGLLPWQWFSGSVNETSRALLAEARLVRSTNLPRMIWVVRVIIAKGIEYILALPVLIVFVAIYMWQGVTHLNPGLLLFPIGLVLQFLLLLGLGLFLAPLTVLVNDTPRVVKIVLRMMFYATPIIFVIDRAPEWLKILLWFNPMSGVLEFYRAGFFPNALNWPPILASLGIITLLMIFGSLTFRRLEPSVLKEI